MELQSFFNPTSVAVVGVSQDVKKVGYLVAKSLLDQGYKGEIFFINPKFTELLGKQVIPSLKAIGKPVDLVVLAVPGDVALKMFDEIKEIGSRNIVLFAAGFKETSEQGALKEEILMQKIKKYELTLLGPNCIGFVSTKSGTNVTFLKYPAPVGNIGCISQSGALGSLMVDYMVNHKNFGFSYFISLGNKTAFDECDALEFLAEEENTKVIAMYLEDVKNGKRFIETLKKVTLKKPVVILKSGTTEEGSKAAVSHTGSMMGNDSVYNAVFEQCGAIRAGQLFEFMTLLKLYTYDRVPLSKDILILSNAGGVGVLMTDELIKRNMSLVTITEDVKQGIIKSMGLGRVSFHNPIDLLGDASAFHYKSAIRATIKEKKTGAVIILLTPQANTEIVETASVIAEAQDWFDTPIYPVFMGEASVGNSHTFFEEKKIASFSSYDFLPIAIAKIIKYKDWVDEQNHSDELDRHPELVSGSNQILNQVQNDRGAIQHDKIIFPKDKELLNLQESMGLLKSLEIPTIDLYLISNKDELLTKAKEIRYPLVAKIASDRITHKTDVKGIVIGIKNDEELLLAWKELTSITGDEKIFIQHQVKGHELIVGVKRDGIFGPVVLVGMGGIYAELFQEVARFVYPFTERAFKRALDATKLKKIMNGFRGSKPVDADKLYTIASRIGQFFYEHSEIVELDINPLMIVDGEPVAIDGRVVLK